ncbi:hypothetical protein GCM10023200_33760 [Actinomycetospora chlora]|uniref:DUF1707 domain-containing protein n=1 Tax=Actinomycetospora chlora TaxID=663608 RepID=A0ABP9BHE5_9PSEU
MADIGAHERELAMEALDEHRRAGRLERAEHAGRCATASRASTRAELDALFADLPDPHPAFPTAAPRGGPATPATPATPEAPELPELVAPGGAAIARHAGLISLLTPAVAAVLFALSGGRFPWIFVLVPVVIAAVAWISHRNGG